MQEITPGSQVTVKIVKPITNVAARKTLERVLAKSEAGKTEKRRLDDVADANLKHKRRGGRLWRQRLPKQLPVKAEVGAEENLLATLDVIRDLKSVERFVEVR